MNTLANMIKEQLAEGLKLERSGEMEAAAVIYHKITDKDPINQEAVARLLVLYRKQKDFREELAVINRALAGYAERGKARQEQWIRAHSKAAAAGTAVFQKLGGAGVSGFGADPVVATLSRRKENVERKISGKKAPKPVGKSTQRARVGGRKKQAKPQKKLKEQQQKQKALRREKEHAVRLAAAVAKKAEMDKKKSAKEAAIKAAREEIQPSLFVISLTYIASLEKIDSAMAAHLAFLDKHYQNGHFLVSGRQVPRTGGVILAKGKDRPEIERLMQADPFVKSRLAEVQIVEFKASQAGKGIRRFF